MGWLLMNRSKELYACLYAREFPAQAMLRLRPELRGKACVIMEGESPLQSARSFNSKASAIGVSHGMTQVEIDTFPSVTTLSRSVAEETAAKEAVLECAGTFSPRVEDQSSDGAFVCVIDIAGTEKLFGPPHVLAIALLNHVRKLGVWTFVTVSSNFHASICLARGNSSRASVSIIPPGEERLVLASLPLTVLDLSEEQIKMFSLWGIHTLGMLAALSEIDLIARMGQQGKRLCQLARGELPHLFLPLEPAFRLEEHMELDTPVDVLDSLLFVITVMLEQLIIRASERTLALASVTSTLLLRDGTRHTRPVRPALPTNDRQLWIKLIRLDFEAYPAPAAILSLTLLATPDSIREVQRGLFSPQSPEPAHLDVTLARIRAIVGEYCVGRAVLTDTHELTSFKMEPFTVPSTPSSKRVHPRHRTAMRQLRPAESVMVTLISETPSVFFAHGTRYIVEHAFGPWSISGNWWQPALWTCEQWDLVSRSIDGTLLCCRLVHELIENCWQMVGLYD